MFFFRYSCVRWWWDEIQTELQLFFLYFRWFFLPTKKATQINSEILQNCVLNNVFYRHRKHIKNYLKSRLCLFFLFGYFVVSTTIKRNVMKLKFLWDKENWSILVSFYLLPRASNSRFTFLILFYLSFFISYFAFN